MQAAVFLAAAAIAAPIAKKLNISSVLGYLAAGILIGPFGLGFVYAVYQVEGILHIAEYGVALLLFLIGLELKPRRLWTMRGAILGLGGAQVLISAVLLTPLVTQWGVGWDKSVFVALALSLSSTAFVLQVLEEKDELNLRHGRAAFSVLLFQDLAAIPLIAAVPLLAVSTVSGESVTLMHGAKAIGAIVFVFLFGRFVLSRLYQLVASTKVREAMTASALLTVVGVALLMEMVGLSVALGAFLAGILVADTPYRHQIEADIAPFEGLLLGLFFTAIGMSLNLDLLAEKPVAIATAVVSLLAVKAAVLYGVGRWHGLNNRAARRLALAVSQGGEFAFVLFATAVGQNVIDSDLAQLLTVIVTVSMLATPILLVLDELLTPKPKEDEEPQYDAIPENDGQVVIAGLGRFGQIVARILKARGIPFTALDGSAEQVKFVSQFGNKAYFGDASRLAILEAAQVHKARAFVITIANVEDSMRTAEVVRRHFPDVPVYARARDRSHVHRLMDLGVKVITRETFLSALDLTSQVLQGIGFSEKETQHMIEMFREHDEHRLRDDYAHFTDSEKLAAQARKQIEDLIELFQQDAEDLADKPPETK
ncbi:MAG: monovalent cation:proton antiporter-2 (CPA2) family protein [Hyphomicrobiaceae bacterium]